VTQTFVARNMLAEAGGVTIYTPGGANFEAVRQESKLGPGLRTEKID